MECILKVYSAGMDFRCKVNPEAHVRYFKAIKYHLVRKETFGNAEKHQLSPNRWCEAMLRAQLAAPDLPEDLRWKAMLSLAVCLQSRGEVTAMLPDADETLKRRFEQSFGEEYSANVLQTGPGEYEAESIRLFKEVGNKYPNEEIRTRRRS